jgi:hypothetical protein
VREQIEIQIKTRLWLRANNFPLPPRSRKNSPSTKARSSARTYELEQLGFITKQTGKDFLGKPRIDYRVATANRNR